jgi:Arm DNA-binding domain
LKSRDARAEGERVAQKIKFTKRSVEALQILEMDADRPRRGRPGRDRGGADRRAHAIFWDSELAGFGLRCTSMGKIYFVEYVCAGVRRHYRIGPHGVWTTAEARREARLLLQAVSRGIDVSSERRALRAAAKAGRASAAGASTSDDEMERAA